MVNLCYPSRLQLLHTSPLSPSESVSSELGFVFFLTMRARRAIRRRRPAQACICGCERRRRAARVERAAIPPRGNDRRLRFIRTPPAAPIPAPHRSDPLVPQQAATDYRFPIGRHPLQFSRRIYRACYETSCRCTTPGARTDYLCRRRRARGYIAAAECARRPRARSQHA